MKITCISTVSTASLSCAVQEVKEEFGLDLTFKMYYPRQIDEEEVDEDRLKDDLKTSDIVLVDIRGSGRSVETVYQALKNEKNVVLNLVGPFGKIMSISRLGSFSGKTLASKIKPGDVKDPEEAWKRAERAQDLVEAAGKYLPVGPMKDASNYIKITKYWRYGGQENYRNLLLLLLGEYLECRLPKAQDPMEFPEYGLYHPSFGHFQDLEEYLDASQFSAQRPTLGILFYGGMHFDQCQSTLKALIDGLVDFNIVPMYSDGIHNLRSMRKFFFRDGRPMVDAIVNLTWFRLNGGPLGGNHQLTRELLKKLNVPVFTPAAMYGREVDKWMESPSGLSPIEAITSVIWPELDGCIEPIPCCGVKSVRVGDMDAQEVVCIDDRLTRIVSRIQNWVALKRKPNNEKKVAVMIYSYPPGEGNLGGASYLDVFNSVGRLLQRLKDVGYQTHLPEKKLHQLFEDMEIVNSGTWFCKENTLNNCFSLNCHDYNRFFESLSSQMQNDMVSSWGPPPGTVMTVDDSFLIPGLQLGNVFVGIQPCRPPLGDEDLASATHDKTKPPHHQYVAYYHWLENVWKADLVVHVGTHGLAEFMKGKEVGMSSLCFPDLLIGNMPHLYFYHVINTSEAVIAKRRLYGTLLGYNSPPYTTSDLYEDYVQLQDLIDEHGEAKIQDSIRCGRIEEMILKKAQDMNFSGEDLEQIHDELYDMKRRIIPKGLHVLGNEYLNEDLKSFLEFVLRYDRNGIKSLNRIVAEFQGIDYDYALRNRTQFTSELEQVDRMCKTLVDFCIDESLERALNESDLSPPDVKHLQHTLEYGLQLMKGYSKNDGEIVNFLRGLDGEYIEQGSGGDVIRSPEILPTGRNLTQFDPTKIPTPTAFERGAEIAQNTLSFYHKNNESYPETTGIVLWGFETTKTGGETIGQIMSYLGVKVERSMGNWAPQIVPIPLEELGRPRIDCLINICGFFRDMFPNVIQMLDCAFGMVAELDEPLEMNYVRKHYLNNLKKLKSENLEQKIAQKMAKGRIFGPKAGEYGTRMLPLVEDSVWKTEEELAEVFIQSMNHLYAENMHAVKCDQLYRNNLAEVEMVSQIRDTHDHEIVDLDHYFEFFGGLSNAVNTVCGKRPKMLISDTTTEVIRTEDVGEVVTRGIRTRVLNPKWIDAMLQHEYHGGQKIADRMYNVLGLAATTHSVDNWIWSAMAQRYIFDQDMRKRLMENNKFSAIEVAERLLEAEKRGYWQATEEEMDKLRAAYLEMEGDVEECMDSGPLSHSGQNRPHFKSSSKALE